MSIFNEIEMRIKSLGPGAYQRLCSEYSCKKYGLINMADIGGKEGTDKTTTGIPDSYSINENGKYTLFMYGTVEKNTNQKIKKDIQDAHDSSKTGIPIQKVEKIVCFHTNTNMRPGSREKLVNLYNDVKIELVDIDTMSHDIYNKYQFLALDHLRMSIDSNQITDIQKFIERYDKTNSLSPLNIPFVQRNEYMQLETFINDDSNDFIIITGNPGVGKTKIAIELCEKYLKSHHNTVCYCVRNNNSDLYEDLKKYLADDGNFILFFDDINETRQLQTIVDYIKIYSAGRIKVIATVREYALKYVENQIKKYIPNPKVFCLSSMSKEELALLLDEVGIKNKIFQRKIISISKNNPRIAIMCANYLKNNRIESLNNVSDVFKSFYDVVINDNNLSEQEIKMLFYLSFLGPIRIDNNETKKLLEELEIFDIDEYRKLKNMELIDFFEEKAVKINDQSFANYILYRYLIEDKKISISELLRYSYPNLLKKFITCINIINKIFFSEDTFKYICDEIKKVWDEELFNNDLEFFESFYNVDRLKALSIIKKEIEQEPQQEFKDEFLIKDDNHNVSNKKVSILSSFKDGEYEQEAIELLFDYLDKNFSIFNDVLICLKNNFGLNVNSIDRNFESEYLVIDFLITRMNNTNKNKKVYETLFLNIVDDYLKLTHNFTSMGDNSFTIEYSTITMTADGAYLEFRKQLFLKLLKVKNDENRNLIYNVLTNCSDFMLDDSSKKILENDIKVLNKELFSKLIKPSLYESYVLFTFSKLYKKAKFNFKTCLEKYKENKEYMTILPLLKREDNDKEVSKIVNTYKLRDYELLFKSLKKFELCKIQVNEWIIQNAINMIFDKTCNSQDFYDIFNSYVENDYPFVSFSWFTEKISSLSVVNRIIKKLLSKKSYNSFWYLKGILDQERTVNKDNLELVTGFIKLQSDNNRIVSLSLDTIIRYKKYDDLIVKKYSTNILDYNVSIGSYIPQHDEKDANKIINNFEDIDLFEKLYIKGLSDVFDPLANYGIELIKRNNDFLINLINNIEKFNYHTGKFQSLITKVWKLDNYDELINKALNVLLDRPIGYLNLHYLFDRDNDSIRDRQLKFLNDYIDINYNNLDRMHEIFSIINQYFSNNKKDLILKLISLNSEIETFKRTVTSFSSESWSGSRIPLIEKKIDYIYELERDIPNRIAFIEHKSYLKELINYYQMQINEEKLREYVDEFFR